MILRTLGQQSPRTPMADHSAWDLVEESQRQTPSPLLLIPQPSHAVLAGDLAEALLPEAFGELPAHILRAIRLHDTGWGSMDAAQIYQLRDGSGDERQKLAARPYSFVETASQDAVAAWKASVDEVEKIAPECAFIVSRHFSLLAVRGDRAHSTFSKHEAARRERILRSLSPTRPDLERDLERWTDALGFCDLLSLYLCSGVSAEATLARVHPARRTEQSPLTLHCEGEVVILSASFFGEGTRVQIHGLLYPAPAVGSAAQRLEWTFRAK